MDNLFNNLDTLDPLYVQLQTASAKSIGRLWLLIDRGVEPVLCGMCEAGLHDFKFQEELCKCECPCHKENN